MEHFEGNNIGSVLQIDICMHTDIESFNPLIFKTGKGWLNIPFDEENAKLDDDIEETANGTIYTYSGFFDLHRQRPEVNAALLPFIGQRAVLRITDANQQVSIIGAPGLPVTIKSNATTGQNYTSKNSRAFNFNVKQTFAAVAQ